MGDAGEQLCRVARWFQVSEVEELLGRGASVEARMCGMTPLMFAGMADGHTAFKRDSSQEQREQIAHLLIQRNAALLLVTTKAGWTPLFFAAFYCQTNVLRLLLQ